MKLCSIKDCNNKFLARDFCSKHLARFYKHGNPNYLAYNTTCSVLDCNKKHVGKGFCSRHFAKYRREVGYTTSYERKPKARYTSSKRYANNKGLVWELTFEEYINLISKNCTYCEGPLSSRVGLDRLDNDLGYNISNVVPCCKYCNSIRSDKFTYEEFLEFSKTDLFKRILSRLHNKNLK